MESSRGSKPQRQLREMAVGEPGSHKQIRTLRIVYAHTEQMCAPSPGTIRRPCSWEQKQTIGFDLEEQDMGP